MTCWPCEYSWDSGEGVTPLEIYVVINLEMRFPKMEKGSFYKMKSMALRQEKAKNNLCGAPSGGSPQRETARGGDRDGQTETREKLRGKRLQLVKLQQQKNKERTIALSLVNTQVKGGSLITMCSGTHSPDLNWCFQPCKWGYLLYSPPLWIAPEK